MPVVAQLCVLIVLFLKYNSLQASKAVRALPNLVDLPTCIVSKLDLHCSYLLDRIRMWWFCLKLRDYCVWDPYREFLTYGGLRYSALCQSRGERNPRRLHWDERRALNEPPCPKPQRTLLPMEPNLNEFEYVFGFSRYFWDVLPEVSMLNKADELAFLSNPSATTLQ